MADSITLSCLTSIEYRPRPKYPAIHGPQRSWVDFVTEVKIYVFEPTKSISARCFL